MPSDATRGSTSSGVILHSALHESALLVLLSSQSSVAARKPSPQTALLGGEPVGALGTHAIGVLPTPADPLEPALPLLPLVPPAAAALPLATLARIRLVWSGVSA